MNESVPTIYALKIVHEYTSCTVLTTHVDESFVRHVTRVDGHDSDDTGDFTTRVHESFVSHGIRVCESRHT